MENPRATRPDPSAAPVWVTAFLQVLGVLLILMTVVAVFFQVGGYVKQDEAIGPAQIVGVVAAFVAGLAAGALMLAIARMLSYWHLGLRSLAALREMTESLAPKAASPPPPENPERPQPRVTAPALDPQLVQNVLSLLNDIRDNTLLGEEERRVKLERLVAEHRRKQIAQFESLLAHGQFHPAERILEELIRRFGTDEELDHLAGRIVSVRAQVESEHVEQAQAKIRDLLSINAWDRAEAVAADLVEQHPEADRARRLLEDVRKQKTQFQKEQRSRLLAEIEKKTNAREWQPAVQTARLLLRLYPDSPEAETVRSRLEILEANAEIALRQALEAQIKDLIKQQRYVEAVAIAERLMRDYPTSPQADALRDQLPRLRDLSQGLGVSTATT